MSKTRVLLGTVTDDMDDFDKIRERIRARCVQMNYPNNVAFQTGGDIAAMIEGIGVTDEWLQTADRRQIDDKIVEAYGHHDKDIRNTLCEAYGIE
ncbi:hypothetical protein ACFL1P_01760 [Patescibacteria group bacterium]